MNRFTLWAALAVAALTVACEDEPVAPATTGTISLKIITEHSSVTRASSALTGAPPSPNFDIAGHLESARVQVSGPTNRTLDNLTPGTSVTVDGLSPGSYTVVLEGFVSGEVDHFGQTSGVQVQAGQNTSASISFNSFRPVLDDFALPTTTALRFTVSFPAIPNADSYEVEWDTDPNFSAANAVGSTGTTTDLAVSALGMYYVRARAFTTSASASGRPGDAKSIEIVTDQIPSGDSPATAASLGFGVAAAGMYNQLNVFPLADRDWFAVDVCAGDVLVVETYAERLSPFSDLDTFIELYDATTTLIDSNDDQATTPDSRIEPVISTDGTYFIQVLSFGPDQTVGRYELFVDVRAGPANSGTDCLGGPVATTQPIAFTSGRDGNLEIYLRSANGVSVTNLTNNVAGDRGPAWSPDGTKIAFRSDRDGNREIYVINADGTNPVNLTNDLASDFYPVWSPDGSKIAFASDRDGDFEIYVMNADGTNVVQLTANTAQDVSATWSSDGSRLAIDTDRDGDREIYVINADGSNPVNVTNEPGSADKMPVWSSDGSKIAFVTDRNGNDDIFVMDTDGANPVELTNDPGADRYPAWSPDGSQLAFGSDRDGDFEIWVMNADGTGLLNLTKNAVFDSEPVWEPVGPAPSSPQWIQLAPTGTPPAGRSNVGAVIDVATNQMIVFGGRSGFSNLNDLWSLTNANGVGTPTWNSVVPVGGPPTARWLHEAVYDAANNRMIVFGGAFGSTSPCTNDVWVLSNANGVGGTPTWTQLFPAGGLPVPRANPSIVYDAASNRLTVFGGNDCVATYYSDVWVLSNANGLGGPPIWTQLTPGTPINSARQGHEAGYDPGSNRMIVFGGGPLSAPMLNEVWVLTNTNGLGGTPNWVQLAPSGTLPPPRNAFAAVYDPSTNRMTIFGGSGSPSQLNDVWVLSGANGLSGTPAWTQLAPTGTAPSPINSFSAVYDPGTNRMIIFGGNDGVTAFNEVWVLTGANGQ